jgi:hypothetical protein
MTTAHDLRSWLMTQPRPTLIRLALVDGKFEEFACAGQKWARLGESCAAMDPVTIYAVDANGKLLRAAKVADIADELEDIDDESSSRSSSSSSISSTLAPVTMQRDDARAMLAVLDKFGTLLAAAHEHSTTVAWDKAFDKMVEIVNIAMNSTVAMQREMMSARAENRRLEREMVDDALERADAAGEGDMLRPFISAYFSGQAERVAEQATTAVSGPGIAKPNGKPPAPQPKGAA